jgi:hypothetical protein
MWALETLVLVALPPLVLAAHLQPLVASCLFFLALALRPPAAR